MSMVLGLGFLLLVSFFVSTLLTMLSQAFTSEARAVAFALDLLLSVAVITVMIAFIFKWLPDVAIEWRDVWLGAFITALLFAAGKWALTLYFKFAAPASALGAFGSVAGVVIWVYYAAQIFFLGAEFTKVYAKSKMIR
jgi:membrane protein